MKMICNLPYNGNLHLKILQEVVKYGDEIVNLSPIRWLQDPLALDKKDSDYKKFKNVREKIESLESLDIKYTERLFNIQLFGELGIYKLTKSNKKTWEMKKDSIIEKLLPKKESVKDHVEEKKSENFCQVLEYYGGNPFSGSGWVKHPDYESRSSSTATSNSTLIKGVNFETREEAINFYETYKRKVFLYLWIRAVGNGRFFCGKFFPWLGDYSHPWTDEQLYEYFGLTDDEIKEIEDAANR